MTAAAGEDRLRLPRHHGRRRASAESAGFDEVKEQFRQRAQQQQIQKLVMDLRQKAKIEER
jgi:hypothetical protein